MILFEVSDGKIVSETGELPPGTRRVRLQWLKDGEWQPQGALPTVWTVAKAREQLEGPLRHLKYRMIAEPARTTQKETTK